MRDNSLYGDLRTFFNGIPGFEQINTPSEVVMFAKEFPEKNLRILVITPIISGLDSKGPIIRIAKGRHIQFLIQKKEEDGWKGCHLRLRDSQAFGNWAKIVGKKIQVLTRMIDDIPKHCSYDAGRLYPVQDSQLQGKPVKTNYVEYECSVCKRRSTSSYAKDRLKTELHGFLKKPKK